MARAPPSFFRVLREHALLFSLTTVLVGVAYAFLTGVLVFTPGVGFWVMATRWFTLPTLVLVAVLSGVLLVLQVYAFRQRRRAAAGTAGWLGTIGSFLVTACPACKPLLLSLLGLSGSAALVVTYGLQIAVVSVLLLAGAILLLWRSIATPSCCR